MATVRVNEDAEFEARGSSPDPASPANMTFEPTERSPLQGVTTILGVVAALASYAASAAGHGGWALLLAAVAIGLAVTGYFAMRGTGRFGFISIATFAMGVFALLLAAYALMNGTANTELPNAAP